MKFSFIIPAFNEEKRIGECLDSLMALPNIEEHEVVVVDNNSKDDTAKIVKERFSGFRLVREARQGMCSARNRGAREATGDILVFFDADCVVPSWWMERVADRFGRDRKLVALSGPYKFFDLPWRYKVVEIIDFHILDRGIEYVLNRLLKKAAMLVGGNIAVRRSVFEKVGGFDENIVFYGEDMDLASRLMKEGKVRFFFDLWVWSSARRLMNGNPIVEGLRYGFHYLWFLVRRESREREYIEVR